MPSTHTPITVLNEGKDAIFAVASKMCSDAFPGKALLETDESYFLPELLGPDWTLAVAEGPDLWSQVSHDWENASQKTTIEPRVGWFQITWQQDTILALRLAVAGDHGEKTRWYLVHEKYDIIRLFFEQVCRYHTTLHSEILVFSEGCWHPSRTLFEAIQGSNLNDLVLHGGLKDQLTTDIRLFFEQEETYNKYKIPWKRGILLLGPPGNGKTHMIRALTNHFEKPCLYVKSFTARYGSPQACVAAAFQRAREVAPCFFVLEDLDTLLTPKTRSFFLNEMDGFASNHGIVTIATCNFPELLDSAITERPSRFDRKYHFDLPELGDRRRYLEQFGERFEMDLRLSVSDLDRAAEATDGYSYAYLKELYFSSAVRWISTESHRPFVEVMSEQAATLREQMKTALALPSAEAASLLDSDMDDDD